jgi:Protein of unknown function (DUF1761)
MIKILLATLVGTVFYFLFGWLIFEGLLGKYMSEHTLQLTGFKKTEEEASMLMLLVSCAAYALLIALVLGQWAQVNTFQEGMKIGAIIGILVAIMTNSYWYSSSHFFNSLSPLLVDVAAAGVTVGCMGGVIAWFLGYMSK